MNYEEIAACIADEHSVAARLSRLLVQARAGGPPAEKALYDALSQQIPHCEKGLCMTPAVRLCNYRFGDRIVPGGTYGMPKGQYGSGIEACDRHGILVRELAWANVVRAACVLLRERGHDLWWDGYSGALNAPIES